MSDNLLEMQNISKSFNSTIVLNKVDFILKRGEIHALMGGNGAGKSTLMKILTGVYQKDAGKILLENNEIKILSVHDSFKEGIAMIFQEFSLIPTLTVAQNIFLTREPKKFGILSENESIKRTESLFDEIGIKGLNPKSIVNDLGVGYWQMTEIVKALSQNTKILIMDEPTSSLTKQETDLLFELINRLKEKEIAIIYISHRMEEIFQICDRVTVLRDGERVLTKEIRETNMNEIIEKMIGNTSENNTLIWKERIIAYSDEPILEVKNIHCGKKVQGINLQIYPGEIVGIAGLMGSGRTELLQAIFGLYPKEKGEIFVNGKLTKINSPDQAMKVGIAMIPEDRRKQGLVLDHSVKENMLLPTLRKIINKWIINDPKGEEKVNDYIEKLNIKTNNINKVIRLLSGGNQQKVVLAKWLMDSPDILLLDEPTIGVDIGAKVEIVNIIRKLADEGKGILVVSSEMTELLAVSDRIIAIKYGKVQQEFNRKNIKSEEFLHRAIQ